VALADSAKFNVIAADSATNTITLSENREFVAGDKVDLVLFGAAVAPTGLATGTYYVITTASKNQIQLATSQANALAGNPIDFTTNGVTDGGVMFNATVNEPDWGFLVTINGQTSDLVQANTDGASFNTQNLPGTLQEPTDEYLFRSLARQITTPNDGVAIVGGDQLSSVAITSAGTTGTAGTYYANILGSAAGSGGKVKFTVDAALQIVSAEISDAGSGYLSTEALTVDVFNAVDANGATPATASDGVLTVALEGAAVFTVATHGLENGDQIYFSQSILGQTSGKITTAALTTSGAYTFTTTPTAASTVYTGVALTGGSGAGAQATVALSAAGAITNIIITNGGLGYVAGESLTVASATLTAMDANITGGTDATVSVVKVVDKEVIALGTTETSVKPYYVTKINANMFKVSSTLSNYTQNVYSQLPVQPIETSTPTVFYQKLKVAQEGGGFGSPANLYFIRGRKYNFDLTLSVVQLLDETGVAVGEVDFRVSGSQHGSATYTFFEGADAIPKSASNDFAADKNYFCVPLGTEADGVGEIVTSFGVVDSRTAGGILPRLESDELFYMPIWVNGSGTQTVLYQGGGRMVLTPVRDVPAQLWNYDAVTSQELIDEGLRGTNNGGVPEAELVESGVSSHALLIEDSQQYYTSKGFLAYYGPHIEDAEGYIVPASPFVAGVAIRRSRAQGFQYPPAGTSYPLNGTAGAQIAISSAEQDVSNRLGMNALRTLPGYGNTVFVWGGRTRVNAKDADQGLYKFVNTRVILNVIYGTLKGAFDSQIFTVVDGRNLLFTKIRTIAENVLYVFWAGGALFGSKPSDAYAVICDRRNNPGQTLEEGVVYTSVFVTPVPTLERIQIDLVRVAIDDMAKTLEARGFGR
jgi:hypothetical protein